MFRAHWPLVLRYLIRRCHGDVVLAEDLASETFARATGAFLGRRGDDGTAAGWLLAIARTTHLDHLRRRRIPLAPGDVVLDGIVDGGPVPGVDEVEAVLGDLPARAARLIRLVHVDGFTPGEVAHMTGQRPETVRTALWRARAMFKTAWEASE